MMRTILPQLWLICCQGYKVEIFFKLSEDDKDRAFPFCVAVCSGVNVACRERGAAASHSYVDIILYGVRA